MMRQAGLSIVLLSIDSDLTKIDLLYLNHIYEFCLKSYKSIMCWRSCYQILLEANLSQATRHKFHQIKTK